jgi:hypothetical protein
MKTTYIDVRKLKNVVSNYNTKEEFLNKIGRGKSWYYKLLKDGTCFLNDALAIKAETGVDLIIAKPVETATPTDNNSSVEKKLDELIATINRLGNVNMQILEALIAIKNK